MPQEILKAQSFKCRFLEAGISTFEDRKLLLIKSEDLMRFAEKFKGFPIIINHTDLATGNIDEKRCGVITNVWKGEDGWAWCEFLTHEQDVIDLLARGWKVSCMYYIKHRGAGGLYHDIPFDVLVLDIEPNHLAIVEDPRYEDVVVIKNSKQKIMKNLKFWSKDKKADAISNAAEEAEEAYYMDGEKEMKVSEIVKNYKEVCAANKKRVLNSDDEMDVDGENVSIANMMEKINSHKIKNSKVEEEKPAEEVAPVKEEVAAVVEEKKEPEASAEEKAAEESKEVAAESVENSKEDLEGFNSMKANILKHREAAAKVANKAQKARPSTPFVSDEEKFERGRQRYGSPQVVAKS